MSPKVLITRKFFPDKFSSLDWEVEFWEGKGPIPRERLLRRDYEALVTML